MSMDLKLHPTTHDLYLTPRADMQLIDGAEQIAQQIEVTLKTLVGEWFLNTDFGVPYFESILVKSPSRSTIESILRSKIKDVPGVRNVTRMNIEIDRKIRHLRVDFDADTVEGLITVALPIQ